MSLPSIDSSLHVATAVLESLLLTWYSLLTCSYLLSWNFVKASFSALWITTMFHFQCTWHISEFVLRHNRNRASSNDTQPQSPLNMHAARTEHSLIKRCAPKIVPERLHLHHHCDEQSTIFFEGVHLFHIIICFCMLKVINAEISIANIVYAVRTASRKNKTLLQNWNMTHWQPPQRPLL